MAALNMTSHRLMNIGLSVKSKISNGIMGVSVCKYLYMVKTSTSIFGQLDVPLLAAEVGVRLHPKSNKYLSFGTGMVARTDISAAVKLSPF